MLSKWNWTTNRSLRCALLSLIMGFSIQLCVSYIYGAARFTCFFKLVEIFFSSFWKMVSKGIGSPVCGLPRSLKYFLQNKRTSHCFPDVWSANISTQNCFFSLSATDIKSSQCQLLATVLPIGITRLSTEIKWIDVFLCADLNQDFASSEQCS